MPIGGISTHSVLLGHHGLPSSELFANLDKLEIGDTFIVTLLNKTMTYKVDNISIVKSNEVDKLAIDLDKDYVTLLICTIMDLIHIYC